MAKLPEAQQREYESRCYARYFKISRMVNPEEYQNLIKYIYSQIHLDERDGLVEELRGMPRNYTVPEMDAVGDLRGYDK